MRTAHRFFRGFAMLVVLSIFLYGLASAQGDSTTHYFPIVFFAEIAFPSTNRVSVSSYGNEGNDWSSSPSISANGRFVAFTSIASDLVSGDTNDTSDVFVYDRGTGETRRVSVASGGLQGNGESGAPSISSDGRYVAFTSAASNLVNEDTNNYCYASNDQFSRNCNDVFVHDMQTGETTRVSVASDGGEGNYWSGSFSVWTDDGWYLYSWPTSLSADGRYVAFSSGASNLVSGDINDTSDVFIHDRQTGETSRVSVASDGTQGNGWSESPSTSSDGRFVAFASDASNLVSVDTNESCYIKYGPYNCADIFVHDRNTGETTRVSVSSDGSEANEESGSPSISSDGRYVAFWSGASNLVGSDGNNYCHYMGLTDWNCGDIFVHDMQTGETTRVSVASDGSEANEESGSPSISGDGRYVAFASFASNLVRGDTNESCAWFWYLPSCPDIFIHDRQTGQTVRVSVASDGSEANEGSSSPSIRADGRYVAFWSSASNLVSEDTNGAADIFVHDRGGLNGP